MSEEEPISPLKKKMSHIFSSSLIRPKQVSMSED